MKGFIFSLVLIFTLSWNVLSQTTSKYMSKDIYQFSQKIAEASEDKIWRGFKPLDFIKLEAHKNDHLLKFSPEPENPNSGFFMTLSDKYFLKNSLISGLSITFHESFHAFQQSSKREGDRWRRENSLLIYEYQEPSAESNVLFNIESKILRLALTSKTEKSMRARVKEFLAVRKKRQSEMNARFVEFEKGAELNEGLAEYAGTKAILLAIEKAKSEQLDVPLSETNTSDFLSKKYSKLDTITKIGKNIRLWFYYTGSAQALLLDRLHQGWKQEVQFRGTSLQDLLTRSLENENDRKTTAAALSKFDRDRILSEEQKSVAQRKTDNLKLLKETLALQGTKIVIDFASLKKVEAQMRFFDPMNVTQVMPNVRVHTRMVQFAGGGIFSAKFDQAVVENLNKKRYTTTLDDSDEVKIIMDGKVLEKTNLGEYKFGEKLEISSNKLKFAAKNGTLEIKEGNLKITLIDS